MDYKVLLFCLGISMIVGAVAIMLDVWFGPKQD